LGYFVLFIKTEEGPNPKLVAADVRIARMEERLRGLFFKVLTRESGVWGNSSAVPFYRII
jgi:hypothetical protein